MALPNNVLCLIYLDILTKLKSAFMQSMLILFHSQGIIRLTAKIDYQNLEPLLWKKCNPQSTGIQTLTPC